MVQLSNAVRRARSTTSALLGSPADSQKPWYALWALMVGWFMIGFDITVVMVANPSIKVSLDADYSKVIWVTSAYLLASTVPLLTTGRLGDRFGPKKMYLIGLTIFTVGSLWCSLSQGVTMLIGARVAQGLGASLLAPQLLLTITQIFPPQRRGMALGISSAIGGLALLVGPFAGGALVSGLSWQWIFLINVPIGICGLILAAWFIPAVPTQARQFDLLGLGLSGIGMFLVVFALQQGQSASWAPWIWIMLLSGVVFMALFVYWQAISSGEPLIPLRIFGNREFAWSSLGIVVYGLLIMALGLPTIFYAQMVCGLSPMGTALLCSPMPIAAFLVTPIVGKIVDRSNQRPVLGCAFATVAVALAWLSFEMVPDTSISHLIMPTIVLGLGLAFIRPALTATATRKLAPQLAGAGSGVYNTAGSLGQLLGSASMAAFIASRTAAEMPTPSDSAQLSALREAEKTGVQLVESLREPFAAVMSQSMLLLALIALIGMATAFFIAD